MTDENEFEHGESPGDIIEMIQLFDSLEELQEGVEMMEAEGKVVYEDGSTNFDEGEVAVYHEDAAGDADVDFQPTPKADSCPYCGGDPTEESEAQHRLSALGYIHDDVHIECSDCGRKWVHGVPIGEFEGERAEELWCKVCRESYRRVHRVNVGGTNDDGSVNIVLHLKCPNCYHFERKSRTTDTDGMHLVGYPDITGSTEMAKPIGYEDDGTQ